LIYGDCRQVEQPCLGTSICKACATRMQAISAQQDFKYFCNEYGVPLARGPGLKPR